MAYTKAQTQELYIRYKYAQKFGWKKIANIFKELYKHAVLNTSNHILIKI